MNAGGESFTSFVVILVLDLKENFEDEEEDANSRHWVGDE